MKKYWIKFWYKEHRRDNIRIGDMWPTTYKEFNTDRLITIVLFFILVILVLIIDNV